MTDTISPAMAPVMRIWKPALRALAATLPQPTDPPSAHAAGDHRLRVLVVGGGLAVGWGVSSHELALPGNIARSLAGVTRRGVDVDLRADHETRLSQVSSIVAERGGARFDAVVLVVGFHEAFSLMPPAAWRRELTAHIAAIRAETRPDAPIIVSGIPVLEFEGVPRVISARGRRHAAELDAESAAVCAASQNAQFVRLSVPSGSSAGVGSARLYAMWGSAIGTSMAGSVPSEPVGWGPAGEDTRQASVDRLRLDRAAADPRIARIVDQARLCFGVETAVFTVLDGAKQHNEIVAGMPIEEVARSVSFCQLAIQEPAGMIVEDARRDPRFRRSPLVLGRSQLRFYAGFPVESPDGQPLGALCLVDRSVRSRSDVDMALLREFALRVQNELWGYEPTGGSERTLAYSEL